MTKKLLKFARANKHLTIDQIATKFIHKYYLKKQTNDKRKILT